jgi:N4-gp56 family major capsid protein
MASWSYSHSDPLTNSRWAKLMLAQFMQASIGLRFASKEDTSGIQILDDLQKHAGDNVTYGVSNLLQGAGVLNLNTLTGNEEAPITYGDTLYVNELAHAVLLVGPISTQRVLFDMRKTGRNRLGDWYAARADHGIFNQACGYTPQIDTRYTGLQATIATSRQILPTGITDAANLTSANTFDITLIDTAVNKAKSLTSGIRPVKVGGRSFYVWIGHNSQVTDMRKNSSTGQWLDIQKAAMTGGDIGDNPIFWESIGMYHGTLLHESPRITNSVANAGTAVSNTKRAIFFGAQMCVMAFGRAQGESQKFLWLEELRDFGRQLGIGVSAVWGVKKVVFNSSDFGVAVIDTYGIDTDTLGAATTNAQ